MINFVYSCDIKYIDIFIISAYSIKKKYKSNAKIFLITTDKFNAEYYAVLKKLNVEIVEIDNTKFKSFYDWLGVENNKDSLLRFGRFMIPYVSNKFNLTSNIVYLDTDTFLNRKINKKYLDNSLNFAFVQDKAGSASAIGATGFWKKTLSDYPKVFIKIKSLIEENVYFNSGVLIINDPIKYNELISKIISSDLKLNDQTMLNYFNFDEIMPVVDFRMNQYLERGWNVNTRIFHFAGANARPFIDRTNQKLSWRIAYIFMGWNRAYKRVLKWRKNLN